MLIGIGDLIAPVSVVGLAAVYLHWLSSQESIHERADRIREALKGEIFREGEVVVEVKRLEIRENTNILYSIQKRIPFLRDLKGSIKITLCSEEKPVFLKADGIGIQEFTLVQQSLSEFLGDEHPPSSHQAMSTSNGEIQTQIEINTLRIAPIQTVLERIPAYHIESLEKYPGEAYVQNNSPSLDDS